jgi:ABC-type Mn2+/Zn2+ transport system permease subunit
VLIAVGAVWGGLALSYAVPSIPPSSAIVAMAGGAYALAALRRHLG